ncbi:tRNA(Met) cytidine acetyltransferase TmcA [Endozoicomonas sp.]|uniref:tRNA(Met) cytidine acetyltransferase TmcA n=1 Tax=Endozoicomonas sp. TaxID=1892382 RepID=UPI002884C193|nr:GNAT family N-acetyltransferase [Endozoicomonas sp.]
MHLNAISATRDLVLALKAAARESGHRRLLVCAGDSGWCHAQVVEVLSALAGEPVFWVGESSPDIPASGIEATPAKKSREWLGREHQNIIFDAYSGFDVDAFGAISGTLCAGGLMVLLTPDLDHWHQFPDPEHQRMLVYPQRFEDVTGRYLKRLARIISSSGQLSLLTQSGRLRIQSAENQVEEHKEPTPFPYKTRSQMQAVTGIHKVLRGHRRRPLVLTADRGRGKSASLGIAAAQLLLEGVEKITITAPSKNTADVFFQHAALVLGDDHGHLISRLEFMAPDDLVQTLPPTQLLLVDEAAAIPATMLEIMLNNYSRIVYATTVHGYEGTGRGFAIRFRKILDAKTPHWHELKMTEPVRWRPNDPLENFVFQALLLDASPCTYEKPEDVQVSYCGFREILPDELLANEDLLNDLFGLLVLAHYQTSPFDLRHLLDGGNMEIYGLFEHSLENSRLVAVLLAAREGGVESNWIDDIWLGRRRVRGHLLPQSLSNQLGMPNAITLRGLRVIRIAVHPDCQRKGFGKVLLHNLQIQADERGLDYLGTLFGATDDLLAFWINSSFNPVRVGVSRDAASGTHSVMMLKPLSRAGEALVNEARERFLKQFQWLLMEELQQLDPMLVASILSMMPASKSYSLSSDDRQNLASFTEGQRQYENCIDVIKRAVFNTLIGGHLSAADRGLLVCRVLQNHSWQQTALVCGLPGQKQARQQLRELVKKCYF